jgi:hypothetical protein
MWGIYGNCGTDISNIWDKIKKQIGNKINNLIRNLTRNTWPSLQRSSRFGYKQTRYESEKQLTILPCCAQYGETQYRNLSIFINFFQKLVIENPNKTLYFCNFFAKTVYSQQCATKINDILP